MRVLWIGSVNIRAFQSRVGDWLHLRSCDVSPNGRIDVSGMALSLSTRSKIQPISIAPIDEARSTTTWIGASRVVIPQVIIA